MVFRWIVMNRKQDFTLQLLKLDSIEQCETRHILGLG